MYPCIHVLDTQVRDAYMHACRHSYTVSSMVAGTHCQNTQSPVNVPIVQCVHERVYWYEYIRCKHFGTDVNTGTGIPFFP